MNRTSLSAIFVLPVTAVAIALFTAQSPHAQTTQTAQKLTGQVVFRRQCASCHGEKGEGTAKYHRQLAGDKTQSELAAYISKSMPPGANARRCSVTDSKSVALFIYDAFYSNVAQARNRPPEVSLSRLTVRQFRNAVSDLLASFETFPTRNHSNGLSASYYKLGRPQGQPVLNRIDPQVHFQYGASVPVPQDPDPYQFSMIWTGSVYAPETGEYEFIVRTEHAVQLFVNSTRDALIDATVKSGDRTEYRGSVYLLSGRYYPLRLELYKGVTGVDNLEKVKKHPPAAASISLEWKRPKLAEEVIPERCLTPWVGKPLFSPTTPFPPDDRSIGYERGNSVSRAWEDATTSAALETAEYCGAHSKELAGYADDIKNRDERVHTFCEQFVERAFRHPLTPELKRRYIDAQLAAAPDPAEAIKRVVLLALSSPRFLYLEQGDSHPDSYCVASRLSFALWDSAPDEELMKRASNNELSTPEAVRAQAERMIQDDRAWIKLRDFFMLWLKADQYPDLAKDAKQYPDFDPSVAADLRTSLELELKEIALGDNSDYRDLFKKDSLFLNGKLSKVYGGDLAQDATFREVRMKPGERYGVLTHPYLMSSLAYLKSSSPIHRGVLIYRNMLGRILQPPPAAFAPLAADLHPDLTTRERVEMQTSPAFCHGCHSMVNPIGYTLEQYDAIGRIRTVDNGKPVNCSGYYRTVSGETVSFKGPADLANYIAIAPEAHQAFVEKLFQNLVRQPIRAFGPSELPELQTYFEGNGYSIRKLVVEIATRASLKR